MSNITDKIDAVTKIPPEYLTIRPPAPKSIKISITGACNHACGYCALRMRKAKHGQLTEEVYTRIVDEAAEMGVQELGVFYMGEPTMLPWLGRAVRIAKARIPYVFMTSNATYYKAVERYMDCMREGLDSLKFSLNYCDPIQYGDVTGCPPEMFYRLLETIKTTRRIRDMNGYATKLWASAIQYDGDQATKMQGVIESIEPFLDGPVYFLPLYSFGSWTTDRAKELGFQPSAGNQGRVGALREPLPCWAAFTAAHVGVDETGRPYLSACCFDASGQWEMADLSKTTVAEGWNSERFQALRAAHLRRDVMGTICEKCLVYA